jgi:hypothetical protein
MAAMESTPTTWRPGRLMTSETPFDARGRTDRRRRPTKAWDAFRPRGRRVRPRRDEERQGPYFVDLIDTSTFVLAVLLLLLTVLDGAVTLILLGAGCEEVNPAMGYLLRQGPTHFLLGKYLLTTAGLPFLLIFRHFTLFGTRFRVGYLLPVFVALYLVLLGYQVTLMYAPDDLGRSDPGDVSRLMPYASSGLQLPGSSSKAGPPSLTGLTSKATAGVPLADLPNLGPRFPVRRLVPVA